MRDAQNDLEILELLRGKDWFKSNKGNMDLAEICEYWINHSLKLQETIMDMYYNPPSKYPDCL